jgi:type I restriction enzyme S subunit
MKYSELGEFMVKRGGSVDPKKYPDETFALLSIKAFDNQEVEILKGSNIGSSKKCVEPNDVLLSKIVPHIRRCWVVPPANDYRQIGSGEWIQFRSDRLFPDYLKYFLLSDSFHSQFMNTVSGVGGSLLRANPSRVASIAIPVFSLAEQKQIAEILDAADSLRQKDQQLIEHYTALSQSLFLDMFGDPVTNPMMWSTSLLGECLLDIVGGKSVAGEERAIRRGEKAVLKISAVTTGLFNSIQYKVVERNQIPEVLVHPRKGDLLFSRANTRELVGAVCIVDADYDDLFLPDKLWKLQLSPDVVTNQFVRFLLTHDGFRGNLRKVATGTSGSMLNISKDKLRKLSIPLPPVDLQNQFATRIDIIEQQKQQAQESLAKSEDLFNSILQRAFTGKMMAKGAKN